MTSLVLVALLCCGSLVEALTAASTVLIFARDAGAATVATGPLNGYGIPYEVVVVPQAGVPLPVLTSTPNDGNFGLIVMVSSVSYDYGADGGWRSAITVDQTTQLRDYQKTFGVRMIHLDVYPGPEYGATALGGCCSSGDQNVKVIDSSAFPTAGLKIGAALSTSGLWHYPSTITDPATTKAFLEFEANAQFASASVAGVINRFADGREQMAFFTSFGTWSQTSTFLAHTWIHWGLRGVYAGYRRVKLGAQVDDVFLKTGIYDKPGQEFRSRPGDMDAHKTWTVDINARMNPGSAFFVELGHNGNGNIEEGNVREANPNGCADPIYYEFPPDTPLEFQKPLGTGTDKWPRSPTSYNWPGSCVNLDPLKQWFDLAANRNAFAHVTHTFTHLPLNNATYGDCAKEITFNRAWMNQVGLSGATQFSGQGIIPPQITGLHNGDCIRAWVASGLRNAVGDNTRPPLRNQQSDHWPLYTTVAANGYAGFPIIPRWATNIYFNCDLAACTALEWRNTAAGSGEIEALLQLEKVTNTRYLLGLHHDPFMFHQANLRQTDVEPIAINGRSAKLSLLQMWVETVVQEMVRLVEWPIVTHKHDEIAAGFERRAKRDACKPKLRLEIDGTSKKITGFQVQSTGNTCAVEVPVSVPNTVTNTQGFTTEKRGKDPLTIWVPMRGSAVTFTLGTAV